MPQSVAGSRKGKTTTQIIGSLPQKAAAGKPIEKSQVRDKQPDCDQRSQELKELKEELAISKAEAKQYKENLEAMVNVDVAKHVADLEKRLAESDQRLQELADMEERVKEMGVDLKYAKEAQETLREELDRVQGELKAAQEQLAQAQAAQPQADDAKVKELQEELAGAYQKVASAERRVTDLQQVVEDQANRFRQELAQFQAAADEANRQNVDSFNAAMAAANTKVGEMEARFEEMKTRLANPGQELAVARQRAAEAIDEKNRVTAAAQAALTAAEELHKKSLAKERKITNNFALIGLSSLFLLIVTCGLMVYCTYFRNPGVVNGPALTFVGHKAQADFAKTPSMTAGGSFPVTPDSLKELTGQNDPTCYVSKGLSMWTKDKKRVHFDCNGQYIKDAVRDCWNVSACKIEVPKNLDK